MDQEVLNRFRTRLLEKLGWSENGADPKVQYDEGRLMVSPGFMEIPTLNFAIRGGMEGMAEIIVVGVDSPALFAHRRNPSVTCLRLKSGEYALTAAVRFVQSEYNAYVRNNMRVFERETNENEQAMDIQKAKEIGAGMGWKPSTTYRGESLERDNTEIAINTQGSGTGRNRRYSIRFCVEDADPAALEAWMKVLTGLKRI